MKLKTNILIRRLSQTVVTAAFCLLVAGCNGGEFRAQDVPSKADVQKDIDKVTASKDIPEGQKPMILGQLKKRLEQAK